jgi:hypothetical protein
MKTSVYSFLSEPPDDYRDLPVNLAASASSEQPKQVRLGLAFYPHPHSLPTMAPRHHPYISPHAAWNASLLCAVCIFWLSKVFNMRLEKLWIREYRRAILGGWGRCCSSGSMPCLPNSALSSLSPQNYSGRWLLSVLEPC